MEVLRERMNRCLSSILFQTDNVQRKSDIQLTVLLFVRWGFRLSLGFKERSRTPLSFTTLSPVAEAKLETTKQSKEKTRGEKKIKEK